MLPHRRLTAGEWLWVALLQTAVVCLFTWFAEWLKK